MTYQSLYRRFRPQRFSDVLGQDHISLTLRNAVRTGKVAHAYLFSGPRGCGKTTSARILAKALNCTNLQDGEPCDECESCLMVTSGASMDVNELDAASNNGVDAMRDLVSRAALGTSGRRKVYIVDEVHMLSTAASNALLKTLEEPPDHVVFVLATTDPQKVLPTIRSRTQHFEFRLFSLPALKDLVRGVAETAGLDVDEAAIEAVARRGNGSARDALSALDQVAASGAIEDSFDVSELASALLARDPGGSLLAVDRAVERGRDPKQLTRDLLEVLREAFLSLMGLPRSLGDPDLFAKASPAMVARALEVLGEALVVMREALDPRITLEVALMRLVRVDLDTSPAALAERLERLERNQGTVVAHGPSSGSVSVAVSPPSVPPVRAPSVVTPPAPAVGSGEVVGGSSSSSEQAPTPGQPPAPMVARPAAAVSTESDPAARPVAPPRPSTAAGPGSPLPPLIVPPSAAAPAAAPARRGGAADAARAALGGAGAISVGKSPSATQPAVNATPPAPRPKAPERPSGLPGSPSPASSGAASASPRPAASVPAPDAPVSELSLEGLNTDKESVLDALERKAKVLLLAGRFVSFADGVAEYGLPNAMHLQRCVEHEAALSSAISSRFGTQVACRFVVDQAPAFGVVDDRSDSGEDFGYSPSGRAAVADPSDGFEDEASIDIAELVDATDVSASSTLDTLVKVFPGAEIVPDTSINPKDLR